MKLYSLSLGVILLAALASGVSAQKGKGGSGHGGSGGGSHGGQHAPRVSGGSHAPSAPAHVAAPRAVPHAYGGTGFGQTNRRIVGKGVSHLAPTVQRGVNAPPKTSFVNPHGPTRTNIFPKPHNGDSYAFSNRAMSESNYQYDAAHYRAHVANFAGYQSPAWGGHWRYGYYNRPDWAGTWGFGFYVYSPFYAACVASPWYYDPWVPPYLLASDVVVDPGYTANWQPGVPYVWSAGFDAALNHAIGEIQDGFANGKPEDFSDLIGAGEIAIFSEGTYEYSLNASDFLQMLQDNISATQTISFTIIRVRRGRNGTHAVVEASHVFQGPDGGTDTVYQRYRLQQLDSAYVITDFMTSHAPY